MSNTTSNAKYTYATFASDVMKLADGEIELTTELAAKLKAKASDLLAAQLAKAEYNATHKSSKAPKGASSETMAKANTIKTVLSDTPMTAAEISTAVGTDFTALQVANAVKYINGVKSCKVVRDTVNAKGLKAQKEYTAYFIG